ncbi:hypothetical protein QYF61_001069 [Mycteria americana]|nr:hypothetical protein QYF61_001069 [Mycteria americana]
MGHNFSGQPVPMSHHPHCKKCLPYVQSKSTLFQFKTVDSCPVTTGLILKGRNKVSLQPSLLQAEQPQLSQPFFVGEVHVFLVLGTPELDAVLQVGSHERGVEGENRLPRPAGHASFDAAQDTIGFLGCECTLPAHVQFFIHQYPQVLLCRAALNAFITQSVLILGTAPTQVQDLALGLVELHEVRTGLLLQPVKVPLDGIPSLRHVNCTTQLGVIRNLAEGALNPTMSLMKILNSIGPTIQPIPYPSNSPSIKPISLQLRGKNVVGDRAKGLTEVQAWCRDHFPGEPVPVTDHPLSEEPFPYVQSELPLTQLHSISPCPIAGHQREEISTSPSAAPLEEAVGCDEVTPQPSLLQAEQAK